MSDSARARRSVLTVDGLGKRFRLGADAPDLFTSRLTNWFGRGNRVRAKERELWALRDVSFTVAPGEVVGLIGHNGAGKSTLLKLLTRVTRPTEGRFEVAGRVGSLLEVGTGFHPELTGRENIYLNGAILGMSRSEVDRRFDEIVAFADVAPFLETQVKRYSSGMAVRLAFAVAAHLEAELLLIDEVLTVGDAAFQWKCVEKVAAICRAGRSAIVVSHNMATVAALSSRGIVLGRGRITFDGPAAEAIAAHAADQSGVSGERNWEIDEAPGDGEVFLRSVRLRQHGETVDEIDIGKPSTVEIVYETRADGLSPFAGLWLHDGAGVPIFSTAAADGFSRETDPYYDRPRPAGRYVSRCTLPGDLLNEGPLRISVHLHRVGWGSSVSERDALEIYAKDGGSMRASYAGDWLGVVRPRLEWMTEAVGPSDL